MSHRLEEGAAPATVNCELATIKRMFRLGMRARKVARRPEVSMLELRNTRKGFFEPEQFEAVVEHLPSAVRPVAEVAYITGWRVASEILTRQWKHIDFAAGWLRLEPGETKNGDGRMFPLTPGLRDVLEAQRKRTDMIELETGQIIRWVFHRHGSRVRYFRRSWITACRKAGVPGRIPHDFRRTDGSEEP